MEEKENIFQSVPSVSANMVESDDKEVDHSEIAGSGGENESYLCKMCGVSVQSSDSLDIHLQSLHIIRKSANCFPGGCHACAEVFPTSELLINHLRREHTVQTFNSCGGCGKKLPRSYSVPTHFSSSPPSKIYCSHCVVEHKHPKDKVIIKDIIVENDEENKLITVPKVSLNVSPSSKSTVDRSKRARSGDQTDSYICQICQLGFPSSVKLDAHLHSSHVVVRFSCGSCKEEFKTLETLMDHLRRVHAVEKIDFCSQCGQKFTSSLSVPVTRGETEPTKVYCDPCMAERQNEGSQVVEVIIERNIEEDSSESNFDVSANIISSDSDSDELHSASSVDDTGDSYICQICPFGLSTSANLDNHLRTLHVVKSGKNCFSCGFCQKTFKSLAVLLNHIRREHTVQKIYSCGQCGKEFPSCHTVPTHDRRKVPSQIHCDLCTVERENAEKKAAAVSEENDCGQDGDIPVDKTIQILSESMVKVEPEELSSAVDSIGDASDEKDNTATPSSKKQLKKKERKFTCGSCSKKFWNRAILLDHEQNHCSDNRCEVCEKKFSSKDNLRRHLLTHSGAKPYLCETCGKGFSQKHVLTDHQRRHTGEKPFNCDICSRSFAQKSLMQQHRSRHMQSQEPGSEIPLFSCNICDRKYKSRAALYEHSGKHENRKFCCDVCPKVYTNRGNLFNHKRIHTGEKPYACEFCGKRFSNGNSIKKHLLTHSGERPYVCDACGKGFTQKTHLKTHLRVHTGEKPYECDICRKMFSHKYVMIAHRRIHTGERPFQCDVCEKGFVEKSQLTKHKRARHGE